MDHRNFRLAHSRRERFLFDFGPRIQGIQVREQNNFEHFLRFGHELLDLLQNFPAFSMLCLLESLISLQRLV